MMLLFDVTKEKMVIFVINIFLLLQVFLTLPVFATTKNSVVYFPNKKEVSLFDLETKTSKKLFQLKEKNYEIDFETVKSLNGKIYFMIRNKDKVRYHTIPGSNFRFSYQEGSLSQKEYQLTLDGKARLLRTIETVALDQESVEIKEMYFSPNNETEAHSSKIYQAKNIIINSIAPESFNKTVAKNGIKLIVENRKLFIEKNGCERELLISADKKVNEKIAYGCYDPSINKAGTKGLCSYFSEPFVRNNTDRSGFFEINLLTKQITKYNEVSGHQPIFSADEKMILYKRSNHYEVFNIQDRRITKLPKSEAAIWVNWHNE